MLRNKGLPFEKDAIEALQWWTALADEMSSGSLVDMVKEFDTLTPEQRGLLVDSKGLIWYLQQARDIEWIRRMLYGR